MKPWSQDKTEQAFPFHFVSHQKMETVKIRLTVDWLFLQGNLQVSAFSRQKKINLLFLSHVNMWQSQVEIEYYSGVVF